MHNEHVTGCLQPQARSPFARSPRLQYVCAILYTRTDLITDILLCFIYALRDFDPNRSVSQFAYGVATLSRLLKILRLFCKRAP